MSIILALPAQKLVLNAFTLFTGTTPSNATFNAHIAYITANGEASYTSFLNSVAKDIPVATLASNMLTNLGLTAVFTQAEAVAYLNSNASNLGGAMTAVATATLNYVSNASFAKNAEMLSAQTAWTNTATNALAYSSATTSTSAGSMTATAAGTTFTLTTSIESLTGSGGDDIFVGDGNTSQVADSIVGGAGTDTLKLYSTSVIADSISGVENLYVYGEGTINASQSGVTSVELDTFTVATDTVTLAAGQTLTITDATASTNNLNIAAAATVTSHTINVAGSGDSTNAIDLQIVGAGVTALTINATGTSESFLDVDFTGTVATTVNIAATSDLTIENIEVATIIAAAGSTGDLTLTTAVESAVTTGTGADSVTLNFGDITAEGSVDLGAGDDILILAAALDAATNLTDSKITLAGGAGTDILEVNDALATALGGLTAANYAKKGISGFETLRLTTDAPTSTTLTMTNLAGFTTVEYMAARDATHTLSNLVEAGTVKLTGEDTDGLLVVTIKDASLAGQNANVLNVTLNGAHNGATKNFDYGTVSAANIETINIASGTSKAATLTLTTGDNELDLIGVNARNINITGAVNLDLSGDALEDTVEVINATALTGTLSLSILGANSAVQVLGSLTKANTVIGSANSDSMVGGAGIDTFTTSGGSDILTGGAGADIFVMTSAATGGAAMERITITDFTLGASADVLKIDFDDIENQLDAIGGAVTSDTVLGDGTSISAATSAIQVLTGAATMGAAKGIFILNAAVATTDALETALEAGGTFAITTGGAIANDDGFFVAYSDGTDSYIAIVNNSSGGTVTSTTFATTDLEAHNVVKLTGITDLSALVAANIVFQ